MEWGESLSAEPCGPGWIGTLFRGMEAALWWKGKHCITGHKGWRHCVSETGQAAAVLVQEEGGGPVWITAEASWYPQVSKVGVASKY